MKYKNYNLHVKHLHKANSSRKQRHNSKYLTLCTVYDKEGKEVVSVKSKCSKFDTPSRKVGFQIAVDRAKVIVDYLAA